MADQGTTAVGLEGTVEQVELSELKIDWTSSGGYQRELKPNRYRILKEFRRDAVGTLTVARRSDSTLWVIDGQQRLWVLLKLGIKVWDALVLPSSGRGYEAEIFHAVNGVNRLKLSQHDLFKAALAAKDPVAIAVLQEVARAGLQLEFTRKGRKWPKLASAGALYKSCKEYGREYVYRGLHVITKAWPGEDAAMRDLVVVALIRICHDYEDKLDCDRLAKVLKEIPPTKLINRAGTLYEGSNRYWGFQKLVEKEYNKRLGVKRKIGVVDLDHPADQEEKE